MKQVEPTLHRRVWGVTDLRPWLDLPVDDGPVGEAWYEHPALPLLKWIFTSEKLSVQVHPDDEYARVHHGANGKTEAWYVAGASPGALLGVGLTAAMSRDQAQAAALDGSIADLIDWRPVRPGDCVMVPAGTIHAIGAGLTLVEIQQVSDITYRLFDYGRGRELHLARALDVADLSPWRGRIEREGPVLAQCRHFRLEKRRARDRITGPAWVIDPRGAVFLATEGESVALGDSEFLIAYGPSVR